MNYKKLLKSRALRIKILSLLNWVPDKIMIPLQYWIHIGRKLNLSNPKRFTEKLQLYKLNYRNPLMLRCTDKYEVRKVIEEMGCKDILIPLIGVYENAEQIDFDKLPLQFVAKTTDGGGGNQVLVCHNKNDIGAEKFYSILKDWMKAPKAKNAGREWAYENGFPRRILIEELISDNIHKDIPDFKFYCFNGEPYYCQLIGNRSTEETIDFYDIEWNHMPFVGLNKECANSKVSTSRPENFTRLKELARILSKDYPFVRVDLYDCGDKIFFGELTFYPASGFGQFTPDEWDAKLGQLMQTPENQLIRQGGGKWLITNSIISINSYDIIDYKFFCFNGTVRMIYVVNDRKLGEGAKLGIYTPEFKKLAVRRNDEIESDHVFDAPKNFNVMLSVAEKLSKDFPHVRVDLYNIEGHIYFGELTFYDGSGYMSFTPDSYDENLGSYFDI